MSHDSTLNEYDGLPAGFLDCGPTGLRRCLGGPALIHMPGRRAEPLFVSVLLHGNETTGVEAVQRVLRQYRDRELPRALSIFVGNVAAAEHGLRVLDGQNDFNRVWPGTALPDSPESRMAQTVVERMRERGCFASLDIHNNSGRNPHYACVNRLDPRYLALASLFSRTIVYFLKPEGVQSLAFASLCPATTVECGQPGSAGALDHAVEFIDAALRLDHVPAHVVPSDLHVYHTVAVARVAPDCEFAFGSTAHDLSLDDDLDELNFRELPAGTDFGRVRQHPAPFTVVNERGESVAECYFETRDGAVRTTRRIMPAMLTRDPDIVRQDCLCYLMERIDIGAVVGGS